MIFLFQGAYSFGWTPLAYLYPPEVLNYPIRTYGMGVNTFTVFGSGLIFVFSTPFMLESRKSKLVVRTSGGLSSARKKLMMSKNPKALPSWLSSPTETNVVGTFVARPTVYWMSRLCQIQT